MYGRHIMQGTCHCSGAHLQPGDADLAVAARNRPGRPEPALRRYLDVEEVDEMKALVQVLTEKTGAHTTVLRQRAG